MRHINSTALLLALGVLIEAALLVLVVRPLALWNVPVPSLDVHIVTIVGGGWQGLAWYLATWALLASLYLLAISVSRRSGTPTDIAIIFCFTALHHLTVAVTYPATSADIFHYFMEARIFFLYGGNPLVAPPAAYPTDPFAQLASWPDSPAPYGPLWILMQWLPLHLGGGQLIPTLIASKLLVIAFSVASTALVYGMARQSDPGWANSAAVMFGWSPLVVLNTAMDGHNDVVMVAFLLAGLYLVMQEKIAAGIAVLMLAAAVKAPALLALPPAIAWGISSQPRNRMLHTIAGLALGGAVVFALYLPFWEGPRTFEALLGEGSYYTASIGTVVHRLLQRLVSEGTADLFANVLLRGGFLALYGLSIMSLGRGRQTLTQVCALALCMYLALAAFWFMPWYAVWPLGLAAASAKRAVIVPCLLLSITAMLNHAIFGFGAAIAGASPSSGGIEAATTLAIWSAPLAGTAIMAWKSARAMGKPRRINIEVKST